MPVDIHVLPTVFHDNLLQSCSISGKPFQYKMDTLCITTNCKQNIECKVLSKLSYIIHKNQHGGMKRLRQCTSIASG